MNRQLVGILILVAGAAAATANDRHRTPTGTTVILHGFQLSGTVPDWPFHMAEAIRVRSGGGAIYEVDPTTGGLTDCSHPACGPQGSGGEVIIVLDWAPASAASGNGFSEAAAETLAADLVGWSGADPPLANLGHLHLIGHSRGAVVASETAERLIAAGLPAPEHLTSLDPHDTGAFALTEERTEPEGLWDDLDVNEHHPDYQCSVQPGQPSGVCSWLGVDYHDNYWRDQDGLPCLFDPDGKTIPGGSDFDASSIDAFCHSDVHAWYHFTIDTAASTHPVTGDPPGNGWFDPAATTCTTSSRNAPLARDVEGYNASRVGGGTTRCPDDPASKQRVLFDFNLPEGVVNGDFEKDGDTTVFAGWSFHGGGGNASLADDGDRYLRVDAGRWRRHNRFLLPADASAIHFCRKISIAGAGDHLTVTLHQAVGSRTLHAEDPVATADWQCFTTALEADEPGAASFLEISVTDDGVAPAAQIGIDDVGLVVGIFFDGFESGDTSRWSSVTP